jgi:2-polyprenyl-6-methoxyphenol hydroxylase-like FAD-dependent oxidoreductase
MRLPGGVALTGNGLSALDHIGALDCIKDKGFAFSELAYTNEADELVGRTSLAKPEFAYQPTRILRKVCIAEWRALLEGRGVPIRYFSRFGGVVSETESRDDGDGGSGSPGGAVTFRINDEIHSASMLVGADGIHSTLRSYVCPSASLEYLGLLGVMAHIPSTAIRWPRDDYPVVTTIMFPTGGFMTIPELPDRRIALVARQVVYAEQDRAGWKALAEDKDTLYTLLAKDYGSSNEILRSFLDAADVHRDALFIWPFYKAEAAEWVSRQTGRVVLIGDAAHALPPSSGQGVNMALEDSYTLGRILGLVARGGAGADVDLKAQLCRWEGYRRDRVDRVMEWVNFIESTTASSEQARETKYHFDERATQETLDEKSESFGWIFTPPFGEEFERWLKEEQ